MWNKIKCFFGKHEYTKEPFRTKLFHCIVCNIELNEPNNYHKEKYYRCIHCGHEECYYNSVDIITPKNATKKELEEILKIGMIQTS